MFSVEVLVFLIGGAVTIVVLNATVILLVATRKELRTYNNGFIVSLAVSDFLLGAVFLPGFLINPAFEANGLIVGIILYTNVANISAVTLERYLAVVRPLQYKVTMTKHFRKLIIGSWVIPIIICVLPMIWRGNIQLLVHKIFLCFLIVFCTILPFIFIIVTYTKVFKQVVRHAASILHNQAGNERRVSITREKRISKVFLIIAATFMITWAPTIGRTVYESVLEREHDAPHWFPVMSLFLMEVSALVNPFLYAFFKTEFRREFMKCIKPVKGCKLTTTRTQSAKLTSIKARHLQGFDEASLALTTLNNETSHVDRNTLHSNKVFETQLMTTV